MRYKRVQPFETLVTKRVDNVAKGIWVLTRLANKNNYDYNDEQVDKIFRYLKKQLDVAEKKFRQPAFNGEKFTLK